MLWRGLEIGLVMALANGTANLSRNVPSVAVPILSYVFRADALGDPYVVADLRARRLSPSQREFWIRKLYEWRYVRGDVTYSQIDQFLGMHSDPIRAILSTRVDMSVLGSGYGGGVMLPLEIFGEKSDAGNGALEQSTAVRDSHLHAGLAFDKRVILQALIVREPPLIDRGWREKRSRDYGLFVIAAGVRWAVWLLESIVRQKSWSMPEYISGSNGMARAWNWVTNGSFWRNLKDEANGVFDDNDEVFDVVRHEILYFDARSVGVDEFAEISSRWSNGECSRQRELLYDLIDLRLTDADDWDDRGRHDKDIDWRYDFVVNTMRAIRSIFEDISANPGDGFTKFQDRCLRSGFLKRLVFEKNKAGALPTNDEATSGSIGQVSAIARSLSLAVKEVERPFCLTGFELRREIDCMIDRRSMIEDVASGIVKLWECYSEFVTRRAMAGDNGPYYFSSPISFQRPRNGWIIGVSEELDDDQFVEGRKVRAGRFAEPWEQLQYAGSVTASMMEIRQRVGECTFDHAVGSIDVSGTELGHATWPYVAAANWLAQHEVDVLFTAHAGESFERGFTGVRVVGELFMCGKGPNRIGHALSLNKRYRRKVENQHKGGGVEKSGRLYIDLLSDLCYLRWVLMRLDEPTMMRRCDELLTRLVEPMSGRSIAPEVWMRAFERLHSAEMIDWVASGDELVETEWQRGGAECRWRSVLKKVGSSRQEELALQAFAWGKILYDDDRAAMPAGYSGVEPPLWRDVVTYLNDVLVRVSEYVVDMVRQHNVTLECCPTSNLTLAGEQEFEDHPIWSFLEEGDVKVSVSSDDPLVFGGFVGRELAALMSGTGVDTQRFVNSLKQLAISGGMTSKMVADRQFAAKVVGDFREIFL